MPNNAPASNEAPTDHLASRLPIAEQRQTAALVQKIFADVFRQSFEPDPAALAQTLQTAEHDIVRWCEQGGGDAGQTLRLALVSHGLDQWGLAYVQVFELKNLPALSALIGSLRTRLGPESDALLQQDFAQIDASEGNAIDFKITLRRGIHLALWHALAACATADEAEPIIRSLGSLMLALHEKMPTLGWRLLADALAHIQIALLGDTPVSDVARNATQQLFDALVHALPKDISLQLLRQAGEAVIAWQNGRRAVAATASK